MLLFERTVTAECCRAWLWCRFS